MGREIERVRAFEGIWSIAVILLIFAVAVYLPGISGRVCFDFDRDQKWNEV